MQPAKIPIWLQSSRKDKDLHSILADLNALESYTAIQSIVQTIRFTSKVNYRLKCTMVIYLHLQQEGFPVVLEDMVKYSGVSKLALLSLINKNRDVLPYTLWPQLEYVLNLQRRVAKALEVAQIEVVDCQEKIKLLYDRKYFYTHSPLLACVYLSLPACNQSVKTSTPAYVVAMCRMIVKQATTSLASVKKEIARILEFLGEGLVSTPDIYQHRRAAKDKKIAQAVALYQNPVQDPKPYATDYESLLIENLVKKDFAPATIANLTKSGMEYYADFITK
ncbi:hypothetical protein NEHOM01_1898 [Nematocida homosporus]|uniref:uncharacterized protein n=1 Tax=Nematocida homosporus TaxID=1912981 RepID=UPI002220D716|nr:uncharacterized protein NEHOM01_1898 [Nematocida homosporus]KAI5187059.1 hypothetical protein NEHOM01_1898 [Nematocida homosporus]